MTSARPLGLCETCSHFRRETRSCAVQAPAAAALRGGGCVEVCPEYTGVDDGRRFVLEGAPRR